MTLELKIANSELSVLKLRINKQLRNLTDLKEQLALTGNSKIVNDILVKKIKSRKKTLLKNKQKYIDACDALITVHRKCVLSELNAYELKKQAYSNLITNKINKLTT